MGAGATGTRGGPGATLSWEAGVEALGHADTRAHLVFCFDLELVCEGTDSGPWAHPRRGCEPTGGANILFPCSLSESCTLEF
jgi:hypothetical protein